LRGVDTLATGRMEGEGLRGTPTVLATDLDVFLRTPELSQEHFGPVTLLVRCDGLADMIEVIERLPGALAVSLHATDHEVDDVRRLFSRLPNMAGRIIWNQFPTGVAVVSAMQHGGPYPASTFPAHTSVGTAAVRRFLRPVTYQNVPQSLLPEPLRDANSSKVPRTVNGRMTHTGITAG
jgi:acyl-CoA reductase-like NAD-dependent aldehyde dehydrogenase